MLRAVCAVSAGVLLVAVLCVCCRRLLSEAKVANVKVLHGEVRAMKVKIEVCGAVFVEFP